MLDAKARHDLELFLAQAEAELGKMEAEYRLTIQKMESETNNRIKEILTIEGARSQWRINEMNVERENRVLEAAELANIEVRKTGMLKWIETESRRIEIEQDLKAGFVFAQKEYQFLQLAKQYLFGLYEERQRLLLSDEPGKADKLKLLKGHIRIMETVFRGQQKGLLQAASREDSEGSDQDS